MFEDLARLEHDEAVADLLQAVARCPLDLLMVVLTVAGHSDDDIAERMHCTRQNVWARRSRLARRLAAQRPEWAWEDGHRTRRQPAANRPPSPPP